MEFLGLKLGNNRIKYIPPDLFQNISIKLWLDLSFNKLQSIPQNLFLRSSHLSFLGLSSNNIRKIDNQTFAGLKTLQTLMMPKNKLTFLANDTFHGITVQTLLLHSNAIKKIDVRAFAGINGLKSLTLFDNPLTLLPDGIFNDITSKTRVSITCNQLERLPLGTYSSATGYGTLFFSECAPSPNFHLTIRDATEGFQPYAFADTGFGCVSGKEDIYTCSLCQTGSFNRGFRCVPCSRGGFYQDEMGQAECKKCSPGTYVSVDRQPGSKASDCRACPYGTLSNETAGHRACKCLHGFYRMDRFGPCTPCPAHGLVCVNDTAVLAPNYYWQWINKSNQDLYRKFLANIHHFKSHYNDQFSRFPFLLPKPLRCPFASSCKGGIDSECYERYQGTLCASCKNGFYFRFNSCLKCPSLGNSIVSSVLVVALFVLVFLMVLWGDSKKAENNRTVADVIMSCFKIVIGFYQVISGIFSALTRVRWPVTLISMEKYLKLMEGNIFQFAPLSCIHSRLRMDPFSIFVVTLAVNSSVISLIFIYLFLKRRHIRKRRSLSEREKLCAESCLKRSCYRNIFLFLMASYPMTSKIIIQILPLPGACVQQCFTDEPSNCISLLKADYSIRCFTKLHKVYWPIGATFSLYPVAFPLLILVLLYKFRNSQEDKEVAFGLRVFFENYKKEFWFWEVPEMYRKLILISLINLLESESSSQIAVTMLTVSAFGIAYTFFRPMKEKFEDRLHTFVLWVIFFDVCLGGVYTTFEATHEQKENDSLFVNILFVVLNSFVLLVALGKGIAHCKYVWVTVSTCLMQGLRVIWQGIRSLKMKIFRWFKDLWLPSSDKPDEKALWISNTSYGSLHN
ncbi:putative leucine-rich repeat-containing protein DDB_G0281931 [Acropora millepora]|uniref:putative leucine-rich repeat-containing protein DDB_G0281931 n=1 Tax=Acropora millepora TaxID=45264 RepID=UPI001CF1E38D|nr:putative leucine-rich repeat-containing protein DDB_G0281931 [Acropora millepora]